MAKKYLKKSSTFLDDLLRFLLTPVIRSKMQVTVHAGEAVEQGEHSSIVGEIANFYSYFGNQYGCFSEN